MNTEPQVHAPSKSRVLIVDDDVGVSNMIATFLVREGFEATQVITARDMREALADENFDLVLLDVRLPDGDGFDLLKELREESDQPVIMMTGLDTPMDRVLGLEFGADDYVGKPFEPKEMAARIRSVLRRVHARPRDEGGESKVYRFAGYSLNTNLRSLCNPDGSDVGLTGGEFDLVLALVEARNKPLSREQLLDLTRSRDWDPFDRSVDVLIGRIRKKIEVDPKSPQIIKTVRGIGYVIAQDVSENSRA